MLRTGLPLIPNFRLMVSRKISFIQKYFEIFFRSHDFNELYTIFSENLTFEGPLYQFSSAEGYINSLKDSPAINCSYEIIEQFEDNEKVNVIYLLRKGNTEKLISQLFQFKDDLIVKIILIFDTSNITSTQ